MPTRSYSGGATSWKKSLFHKDIFSFISFYPRLSAFIPVEQTPEQPRRRLQDLIHLQIHIPGFSTPAHAQPSDLDFCPAEVDQEAGHQTCAPHVIQTLAHMSAIKGLDCLHLDQNEPLHKKVGLIVAHIDAVIEDLDALLLDHLDLRFAQFVGKRILVDLFQKARTQFIGHPEAAADDQPGEGILDSHGTLSPPIPAGTPEEGFDGDEGDQRG